MFGLIVGRGGRVKTRKSQKHGGKEREAWLKTETVAPYSRKRRGILGCRAIGKKRTRRVVEGKKGGGVFEGILVWRKPRCSMF